MVYTDTIVYHEPPKFSGLMCPQPKLSSRLIIDPDSPVYQRAKRKFNQREYLYPAPPIFLGKHEIKTPSTNSFVLRLPIKTPNSNWCLPVELNWLAQFVWYCANYQQAFPDFNERYFYITVRSGKVATQNDDVFHVDGFQGALIPRHLPEQNYLWVDKNPTLFAIQPYFCEDLDPAKHNIHRFFDLHTNRNDLYRGVDGGVYLIDPYHVHARRRGCRRKRTVVRLTCLTTEIRDDTNTKNPALPMPFYGKADPRDHFWDFPFDEPEIKYGLQKHSEVGSK